ncbi:MAG TPA: AAA family ATPase [Leptospiraceae bacterium]|nr:AAA family ATPase [Leptospiraceae bacterium]HMW03950.1 AAA family ATPase [Leptospiraceae bacterium]HMX33588.1 AAA family ATPase [Leptospiraceae bacterium]HMY29930.1 AAA family ATPase [Leptospiraceae bacterium]HMZ67109.1 AAA family ATPase [Leptospiraceae bacterium]
MSQARYLEKPISDDLETKMVLIAGPRQVGKTSLSLRIGGKSGYLNWDIPEHRDKILQREFPPIKNILILDEIHKNRSWRELLKSLTDDPIFKRKILVTGSAKLDAYRRGGDSLQGRYFFHRMHPFSGDELNFTNQSDWQQLLTIGGFPEPFLNGEKSFSSR